MLWIAMTVMVLIALGFALLPVMRAGVKRETLLMVGLVLAVPLAGVIGYEIGLSRAVPVQGASQDEADMAAPDPAKMVAQLEARLQGGGGTADEWNMLARSYVVQKRYPEAVAAFAKANALQPADAQLLADYADALALSKGGLEPESEALIDQALRADPLNPKALALKATVAYNHQDYQAAIALWTKILSVPGLNPDWAASTRANIEEARSLLQRQKP